MLGYDIAVPEQRSTYGLAEIGETFWRSELQCQGDEESLEDCPGKENPGCKRGEVAGVTCYLGCNNQNIAKGTVEYFDSFDTLSSNQNPSPLYAELGLGL